MQSVKVRELPRLDDDFAQLASEFDTLEELRDDLRNQVAAGQAVRPGHAGPRAAARAPDRAVEVPVPDGIVEDEVHRHLENEDRLEDDEHRAEVEVEARKAFKTQLLLDAVAEKEQVAVNQQELVEYLVRAPSSTAWTPNEFAKAVDEAGQVPAMVSEVARAQGARRAAREGEGHRRLGQRGRPLRALRGRAARPREADESGEAGEAAADQAPVATTSAASDPTARRRPSSRPRDGRRQGLTASG